MQKLIRYIRNKVTAPKPRVIITLIVLAITVLIFFNAYNSRNGTGIDSISYISIAEQYAKGDLANAINAYWSPAISWLMAVWILLGSSSQMAFVISNILISGTLLLVGSFFVYERTGKSLPYTMLFVAILAPFLIANTGLQQPDMFVVLWVTSMIFVLLWAEKRFLINNNSRSFFIPAIIIGLFGGIGYLIKLYLVPFFVLTVVLYIMTLPLGLRVKKQKTVSIKLKLLTSVLLGYVLVAGPWVIVLSNKYERPMFGSSFNITILSRFDPTILKPDQLLPAPPNDEAVAIGEDRTVVVPRDVQSSDEQKASAQISSNTSSGMNITKEAVKYLSERAKAFPFYVNRINSISPFIIPTFSLLALMFMFGHFNARKNSELRVVLIIFISYFLGYALITATSSGGGNTRYYWPMFSLFSIGFTIFLHNYLNKRRIAIMPRFNKVLIYASIAFVPLLTIMGIIFGYDDVYNIPISNPAKLSESRRGATVNPFQPMEQRIVDRLPDRLLEDNIIEHGSRLVGNNYRQTVHVAFHLKGQAYGISGKNYDYNDSDLQNAMKQSNIDYFIKYTPVNNSDSRLSQIERNNLVKTYILEIGCDDVRATVVQPCVVDILNVEQ